MTDAASDASEPAGAAPAQIQDVAARMAARQVLFIGGAMRSGTTVIHRALCTASNSNPYISESWFVYEMMMVYRRRIQRYDLWMADQLGPLRNFRDLIRLNIEQYFLLVSARYGSPELLILKHPALTSVFPEMGEMFPSMQFLVVVRDPRDVIASIKSAREHHVRDRVASALQPLDTTQKLCKYYLSYYDGMLGRADNRCRFVRYEDVMRDPRRAIATIGKFCGGRYDLEKVSTFTEEHAAAPNLDSQQHDRLTRPFWSELWRKGLSEERIGRYRETLTEEEVSEIETLLGTLGRRFKYW